MLLLGDPKRRSHSQNLALGGTTAVAAGMVNVSSVMAFFAFSSNVTGHVAILTEELSKGHWHQVMVVFAWLFSFLLGSVVANSLVGGLGARWRALGHSLAPITQILLLLAVAYYCHFHYAETLRETEYLVAALLFSMGLQNSTVATVSGGAVKTTHLTGLFTDLGMEIAMLLRGEHHRDPAVTRKFALHMTVLVGYLFGGLVGGLVYMRFQHVALLLAVGVLTSVLVHDAILWLRLARPRREVQADEGQSCRPWPAE